RCGRSGSWLPSETLAIRSVEQADRRVLAELQSADIGGDRPAIRRGGAIGVGVHHPMALGDDIDDIVGADIAQPCLMIARRLREAAIGHRAVAIARGVMAR